MQEYIGPDPGIRYKKFPCQGSGINLCEMLWSPINTIACSTVDEKLLAAVKPVRAMWKAIKVFLKKHNIEFVSVLPYITYKNLTLNVYLLKVWMWTN